MKLEWIKNYLKVVKEFENFSKCQRKKVACILVKNNSIISSGVNGTLPNFRNCSDNYFDENGMYVDSETKMNFKKHSEWSELYEIHAEQNAITKASNLGIKLNGSICFVSYSPCITCLKLLISSGIKEIYFLEYFKDFDKTLEIYKKYNIKYKKIKI